MNEWPDLAFALMGGPVSALGQANKTADLRLQPWLCVLHNHTADPHRQPVQVHLPSSVYLFTMAAPKKVCIIGSGNWQVDVWLNRVLNMATLVASVCVLQIACGVPLLANLASLGKQPANVN